MNWLLLLLAGVVAAAAVPIQRRLARATGLLAQPRQDRFHTRPTPLLGGVACLAGVTVAAVAGGLAFPGAWESGGRDTRFAAVLASGCVGFLGLGLRDDWRSLSAPVKGIAEGLILLGAILVWEPAGRWSGAEGIAAAWIAGMILINAWNYLDHADGFFAAAGIIAAVVLASACGAAGSEGLTGPLFLWALAGALIGFLLWNRPPARIFLGDAGTLPIGFLLAFCSLALLSDAPASAMPAAIGAHALALSDFVLVTGSRLARGRNPFVGGREHTGHRLVTRIGPLPALAAFCSAAIVLGIVSLWLGPRAPLATALALLFLIPVVALAVSRIPPPAVGS